MDVLVALGEQVNWFTAKSVSAKTLFVSNAWPNPWVVPASAGTQLIRAMEVEGLSLALVVRTAISGLATQPHASIEVSLPSGVPELGIEFGDPADNWSAAVAAAMMAKQGARAAALRVLEKLTERLRVSPARRDQELLALLVPQLAALRSAQDASAQLVA